MLNDNPAQDKALSTSTSSEWQQMRPGLMSGLKFFCIGFLILLLLIPLHMVENVIDERAQLSESVAQEIASNWGGEQTLLGPLLVVPYTEKVFETASNDPKGKAQASWVKRYGYFLPKALNLTSHLAPEVRYRSIYDCVVYTSDSMLSGSFDLSGFNDAPGRTWDWSKALLLLGVGDVRGIQSSPTLTWNTQHLAFLPSTVSSLLPKVGVHSSLPKLQPGKSYPFNIQIKLNGHRTFNVVPVGESNHITIQSPWKSPSFIGSYLPKVRDINARGFKAQWEVSYFARNYPQSWDEPETTNREAEIMNSAMGVSLITTVDFYQKVTRSAKYGILFLAFTFLTFFLFEAIVKTRIHIVQYILVGLALCLFYLMLLSLSELLGFSWAYFIAAIPTVALISWYAKAFSNTRKNLVCGMMALILSALYLYLFTLLQLEDYALVCGTVGLFVALAAVMYVTRHIDWYSPNEPKIS